MTYTPPTMNPGAYAARLGVTLDGLRKAAVKHDLPWQPGDKSVPVAETDARWADLYEKGLVKSLPPGFERAAPSEGGSVAAKLQEAKLRKTEAEARHRELLTGKLDGSLIPVERVTEQWFRIAARFDALLDALPDNLAPLLPGDPRETARSIRGALGKAREDLYEDLEAWAREAEAEAERATLEEPLPDDDDEDDAPKPAKRRRRGA